MRTSPAAAAAAASSASLRRCSRFQAPTLACCAASSSCCACCARCADSRARAAYRFRPLGCHASSGQRAGAASPSACRAHPSRSQICTLQQERGPPPGPPLPALRLAAAAAAVSVATANAAGSGVTVARYLPSPRQLMAVLLGFNTTLPRPSGQAGSSASSSQSCGARVDSKAPLPVVPLPP